MQPSWKVFLALAGLLAAYVGYAFLVRRGIIRISFRSRAVMVAIVIGLLVANAVKASVAKGQIDAGSAALAAVAALVLARALVEVRRAEQHQAPERDQA